MPFGMFSLYTLAGSGLWNAALLGLGYLLGTQYRLIEEYSRFLNYAVYAALGVTVVLLVVRRVKRTRASR
jgi:membrane protein DedA with SNARE-associated domain